MPRNPVSEVARVQQPNPIDAANLMRLWFESPERFEVVPLAWRIANY